jgi:hypothetical protein
VSASLLEASGAQEALAAAAARAQALDSRADALTAELREACAALGDLREEAGAHAAAAAAARREAASAAELREVAEARASELQVGRCWRYKDRQTDRCPADLTNAMSWSGGDHVARLRRKFLPNT